MTPSDFSEDEIERRAKAHAHEIADKRIEDMADREGERLAVLETEMRHTREAFEDARQ